MFKDFLFNCSYEGNIFKNVSFEIRFEIHHTFYTMKSKFYNFFLHKYWRYIQQEFAVSVHIHFTYKSVWNVRGAQSEKTVCAANLVSVEQQSLGDELI